MYIFNSHSHKVNQTLLQLLGLWPYKRTKFQRLRAICFYASLVSFVLVQLAQFAVVDFNCDVLIRVLSDALPACIYVVKFNLFFCDAKGMKQILGQIMNDWRMLTDMKEIKIMEYYALRGRHFTIFLLLFLTLAIFGFLVMELIPDVLDFVSPLNESRTHYLPPVYQYGYEGTYFYILLLYVVVNIMLGGFTLATVSSMLIMIILHCCAILKITSYRIEHSIDKEITMRPDRKHIMTEKIIKSVELHRNALKLIYLLSSNYSISYLLLILLAVTSLSMNAFRLLRAITYVDNFAEVAAALAFVIGHQFFLFAGNYSGQLVADHSNELFNAIYRSLWYMAPVTVQRLLLIVMQCNLKGSKLNASNVFTASLEGFTTLSSTSMSYFMVIYSTQQLNN